MKALMTLLSREEPLIWLLAVMALALWEWVIFLFSGGGIIVLHGHFYFRIAFVFFCVSAALGLLSLLKNMRLLWLLSACAFFVGLMTLHEEMGSLNWTRVSYGKLMLINAILLSAVYIFMRHAFRKNFLVGGGVLGGLAFLSLVRLATWYQFLFF